MKSTVFATAVLLCEKTCFLLNRHEFYVKEKNMFGFLKRASTSARIKIAYENSIEKLKQMEKLSIERRSEYANLLYKDNEVEKTLAEKKLLVFYLAKECATSMALHQVKADYARFQRKFDEQDECLFEFRLAQNKLSKFVDSDETKSLEELWRREYDAIVFEVQMDMRSAEQ